MFQSALRFAVVSDLRASDEDPLGDWFQSALRFAVVSDRWPLRAWRDFKSRLNPLCGSRWFKTAAFISLE